MVEKLLLDCSTLTGYDNMFGVESNRFGCTIVSREMRSSAFNVSSLDFGEGPLAAFLYRSFILLNYCFDDILC